VQVGATAGVGLAEGRKDAIKWSQLAKMFAAWVFTLVIGGVISGVLFAWVSYTHVYIGPLAHNNDNNKNRLCI
jgi:phosphate/sulfate permease